MKDINELLNMTITREKNKSLRKERFSERIKSKVNPNYTSMSDVVPPLGRGDFLHAWNSDRKELVRVKEEKEGPVKKAWQVNLSLSAVNSLRRPLPRPRALRRPLPVGHSPRG